MSGKQKNMRPTAFYPFKNVVCMRDGVRVFAYACVCIQKEVGERHN